MKITASKTSAIIFTLISVAAFAWMTMRPSVDTQATGFGLASNDSASKAAVASPTNTDTSSEKTDKDADSSSSTESNPAVESNTKEPIEDKSTDDKTQDNTGKDVDPSAENTSGNAKQATDAAAQSETKDPVAPQNNEGATSTPTESTTNDGQTIAPVEPATNDGQTTAPVKPETNEAQTTAPAKQETNEEQTTAPTKPETNEEQTTAPAKPATNEEQTTAPAKPETNEEQTQTPTEPTTLEAPTAPTAPTSPVAPSSSTDDQASKKKVNVADTTATNSVETTDSAAKTDESNTTSKSNRTITAAAVATATIAAQNSQSSTEGNLAEIYTQSANARGTVVILPGCDYKPNTEGGMVSALHKNLPKKGWNTLSFQLPTLSSTSTFEDLNAIMPETAKNIESSIARAKEKSDTPITLLAHGCGSQIALAWMEVKGSDSIDAFIGLGTGMMNNDAKDTNHLRLPLEAMKFPQLDIFGSADNEAVLKTAAERLGHINRAANAASRQKMIRDADHKMTGKEELVTQVIAKWLDKKAFKK